MIYTKSDIGKYRDRQEDYVLGFNHSIKDTKLLLVCDGMGGKTSGEIASNYIGNEIKKAFLSYDEEFDNIFMLKNKLFSLIDLINNNLISQYGENKLGSTLCMAIVLKKITLIINLGDSRCYSYKDGVLTQELDDDSEVFPFYKNGKVYKNDLKYIMYNNIINRCIGLNKELCVPSFKIINNDYDKLLIFSDGVTDLIDDDKIKDIIDNSSDSNIINNIIYEAVYVDQHNKIPDYLNNRFKDFLYIPKPGKDNASGVIYINK